mgnify:CR=1 FL=1
MKEIVEHIKAGKVAVVPTDTLYGIIADAHNSEAVEKVYKLKKRNRQKACIVLINNIDQLKEFGCMLPENIKKEIKDVWPGPITILLPVTDNEKAPHVHRGLSSIAFRMPHQEIFISQLIHRTGPIIAPSANTEGGIPAKNIQEAKEYFGDTVVYHDIGDIKNTKPSTIIAFDQKGQKTILRP